MFEQFPAIVVVVPLIAAAFCAIIRYDFFCWIVSLAVTVLSFFGSIYLLQKVQSYGPISYKLGGWAPPVGIEYRVDLLSSYLLILVSLIAGSILIYGRRSIQSEIDEGLRGWFYSMYLLCMSGLLGIVITGDAFNAFVFMEISSLAMYTLIALGRDRRALIASYQYLIMGTIGATMYVIGVGLLFTVTGTLNLSDLSELIPPLLDTSAVKVSMAFIVVGLSLKIALFPLHFWLPNAYAYAPSVTTAFLAATATKVSIYLLMRYLYSVYDFSFEIFVPSITVLILILSVFAIFVGSFSAIFEENIKRLLAFSSVAQIGYITLGVSIANASGLTGSIVHIFNHAIMKASLFMLVGSIAYQMSKPQIYISDLAGAGRKMPITMFAMTIAGMSLLGVPGTVGFVTKWYLVRGALENGWWWLVGLILISSLMVLVYIGRIIEVAYFKQSPDSDKTMTEPPLSMTIMSVFAVIAAIYFGIDTSFTLEVAKDAVFALVTVRQ